MVTARIGNIHAHGIKVLLVLNRVVGFTDTYMYTVGTRSLDCIGETSSHTTSWSFSCEINLLRYVVEKGRRTGAELFN